MSVNQAWSQSEPSDSGEQRSVSFMYVCGSIRSSNQPLCIPSLTRAYCCIHVSFGEYQKADSVCKHTGNTGERYACDKRCVQDQLRSTLRCLLLYLHSHEEVILLLANAISSTV